jgi:hypothetical protein
LVTLRSSAEPRRYGEAVRWACLHLTAYDFQSEGGRGWYLHEAARLTGLAQSIEAEVVDRFAVCPPDGWRFHYLLDILTQFALDGSERSRQALWEVYSRLMARFARTVRRDVWWSGVISLESLALALVRVDGWDAARTALSDFGDALAMGPEVPKRARWVYFPDYFDPSVRERFGAAAVDAYLADQPAPGLRVYGETAAVWRTRPGRGGDHSPEPTVAALVDLADRARRGEISPRRLLPVVRQLCWRRDPVYADQVARLGLAESDPVIKTALLWWFRRRAFPLPDDDLAPLVDSDHDELRGVVRSILGQRPAAWKRQHALDLLKDPEQVGEALNLLQASYRPEDEPVVEAAIRRLSLRHDTWHAAYHNVIDLLRPDDRPVATRLLEHIYRQSLCSGCRESAVRLMRDKRALPDEIARECLWDAQADIRQFAAQLAAAAADRAASG